MILPNGMPISVASDRATFASVRRNEGKRLRVKSGKGELAMDDNKIADLPDGTDTVIEGAANTGAITTDEATPDPEGGTVAIENTAPSSGLADRLRSGREKLSSQAGDRARGMVSQGLERTAEALANVSRMVGDTASGIEERLGPEYGDYARRAASSIENVANTIASKDPDELIDDTREFVRQSPGIALAGAAVVGFVVARLIKGGLASGSDEDDGD
jgi:ElaB/YqjD/DUF883 family membrane-anchored ribosome-binding protein